MSTQSFCPAAKVHVTDACMQIPKAADQLPSLNTPAEPGPTGGLHAGSVDLVQTTDSLAYLKRGEERPCLRTHGP